MKVKELIEKLSAFDPELPVVVEVGVDDLDYPTSLTHVKKAYWADEYCLEQDDDDDDDDDPIDPAEYEFVVKLSGFYGEL